MLQRVKPRPASFQLLLEKENQMNKSRNVVVKQNDIILQGWKNVQVFEVAALFLLFLSFTCL